MAALFNFRDADYNAHNKIHRNRRFWTILVAVCFFLALAPVHIHFLSKYRNNNTTEVPTTNTPITNTPITHECAITLKELDMKRKTVGKDWIVVTTINQPTDAMELLCNLEGWNVVVVADTKSPTDWTCGSCVYLSVQDQKCLSYGIVEVIPYRAYTRKNIGYLWAIQQGATKVFDTDDDNLPTGKNIIFENSTESVVGYRSDGEGKSVNIYSHFGRPDIWPRGFPLQEIDIRRPTSYLPEYESLPVQVRNILSPPMMIQQGLADLDPDVDAIFRLTQVQELKQAKFCKKSPSIRLSPGTFCPFNSQNTLFSYDAFWGLVLPITVSFRVCDIWRGYWVQRLLWDVNGSLGFTKPTVNQIRNAHNYLDDYMDELQIYAETSKFVDFLNSWNSTSTQLEVRIVDLMKAMAQNNFVKDADVDLAERWVKDLHNVGYVFPKVTPYDHQAVQKALNAHEEPRLRLQKGHQLSNNALKQCQLEADIDPAMSRIRITERQAASESQIAKVDPSVKFKDVLLIVNFNHPTYDSIAPYLSIYAPYFPNIAFYGPKVPTHLHSIVTEVPYDQGFTGYRAISDAVRKYPDYAGYLYTNDDTALNVFQLAQLDLDKVWKRVPDPSEVHDRAMPAPSDWYWWGKPEIGHLWDDPSALSVKQKQQIAMFSGTVGPVDISAWCDFTYVPGRLSAALARLLDKFVEHKVHLEMAVGLALVAVETTEAWEKRWREVYLWGDADRAGWRGFLKEGVGIVHPVKLTADKTARKDVVLWIESVNVV